MSRNRASKAELLQRRQKVQEYILHGHNNQFIIDTLSEEFKTSKRAIQEDIRIIGKEWKEKDPDIIQQKRNMYYDRLQLLFNEAFGKGHIKVALEVQKEIHKLDGIYQDEKEDKDTMPKFVNIGRKSPLKVVDGTDE